MYMDEDYSATTKYTFSLYRSTDMRIIYTTTTIIKDLFYFIYYTEYLMIVSLC